MLESGRGQNGFSSMSKNDRQDPCKKLPERVEGDFRERSLNSHTTINMERLQLWPSRLLYNVCIVLLLSLAVPANALYFYLDSTTPKCFYEELPKDTLVVGQLLQPAPFSSSCSGYLLEIK